MITQHTQMIEEWARERGLDAADPNKCLNSPRSSVNWPRGWQRTDPIK